jgi:cytidyltransferase-like protein
MSKIALVCGYFDPLHIGHLDSFRKAKALGDKLIVIVNNDQQAILKKEFFFMEQAWRMEIIKELKMVDEVVLSIDTGKSVCETIRKVKSMYPNDELILTKGGDRRADEVPEKPVCDELGIQIIDKIGDTLGSSSLLAQRLINFFT